ncbi:MAG: DUF547 domain-containing protein [Cyclobacteriaceae bacterium]
MRKFYSVILLLSLVGYGVQAQDNFFDNADRFFEQYVSGGLVDYTSVRKNPKELTALVDYINDNAVLETSNANDKALLINAYNLFVIKGIVDAGEVGSPMDVSNFFDSRAFSIQNKKISLNELEKDVLLKQTGDARLHFALVCAAKGCPQIIEQAYRPETLDAQLTEQTQEAMNSLIFTKVDAQAGTVQLSRIFEWYRSDFGGSDRDVLTFINLYRRTPLSTDTKISYYEYDWTLNKSATVVKEKKSKSTSNLLQFTPSQLFGKGQYEVNIFNNLYSQTSTWDSDGNEMSQDRRISILTSTVQFTYGVSNNSRINVGADIVLSSGSVGNTPGGQLQLFASDNIANDVAVTAIGPRIKFQPIRKYAFFSMQSSFLAPVAGDPEAQTQSRDVFLALNRYQWRNQFFLDLKLTQKLRLFYQLDVNYLMRRDVDEVFFQPNFVDLPSTAFLNFFPTEKWSLYVSAQYFSRYGNTGLTDSEENVKFGLLQSSIQLGAGVKYQATRRLGFELGYGDFVTGQGFEGIEMGAGEVLNFGIRYIR